MNSNQNEDILKNLINNIEKNKMPKGNLTQNDIREKIKSVNKNEVIKKLQNMGLGNAARMLQNMTDEEIIREVSKNPAILKKLNSLLK
ncbi:MAG: hypothetical protein J6R68_06140 [Clostridia bacterium]|nr:hypothetical protein [Clostridia bacterium]MBO7288609.1 hypothetical protein [Clostridia bacterium]